MNVKFLDLKVNYKNIKIEIQERINNVLDKTNYILGEDVNIFEKNFANYIDSQYFIGVANGTDALEIAIQSLNLSNNDEVIVQGNTFISTCLGVTNNKIKLITCDIDINTHMIDICDLKNKITNKTKVLILVHLYGLMPNMNEIVQICKDNNIILIEDCAQAHGASYKGRKAGTFGELACFSFYPGKNLGAYGDGGGIATNSKKLYDIICRIRNTGCVVKYQHEIIGRNSRLDTIQAAILDVKLNYLEENNNKRREIANIYFNELKNIKELKLPVICNNVIPVWHLFVIQTNNRNDLKDYLNSFNIETLIHYPKSISEHVAFEHLNLNKNINAMNVCKNILSLPIYPELEHDKVKYVCDIIKQYYTNLNEIKKFTEIKTLNKPGILHCINDINFNIQRIFYIDNFNDEDLKNPRGNHANINCMELLFITRGKIKLTLTNQKNHRSIYYLNTNDYIIINKLLWLNIEIIDTDTTIMVLCDKKITTEEKKECINDFEEFLNYKST